jgi:hypothetical protein
MCFLLPISHANAAVFACAVAIILQAAAGSSSQLQGSDSIMFLEGGTPQQQ